MSFQPARRLGGIVQPIRVRDTSQDDRVYCFDNAYQVWKFVDSITWADCVIVENLNLESFRSFQLWSSSQNNVVLGHYAEVTGVLVVKLPQKWPLPPGTFMAAA